MRHAIFAAFSLMAVPLSAQSTDRAKWGDELAPVPAPDRLLAGGSGQSKPLDWPAPPLRQPPDPVKVIYVNAWSFRGNRFRELVRLADTIEINSFVIDVKDDTGYLTYKSEVP